jgi:hypothetical protein
VSLFLGSLFLFIVRSHITEHAKILNRFFMTSCAINLLWSALSLIQLILIASDHGNTIQLNNRDIPVKGTVANEINVNSEADDIVCFRVDIDL